VLLTSEDRRFCKGGIVTNSYVHLPFKGAEIYLLHKAFIDAGGSPNENYKTVLEKTVPFLSNKTQKASVRKALPSIRG
jgi:hypothetical protein